MSPSALPSEAFDANATSYTIKDSSQKDPIGYLLDRDLNKAPKEVVGSSGSWIHLKNGQKVFDATCGAAVACLGHQNKEVEAAMIEQMKNISYCHSMFFSTPSTNKLAEILIEGTDDRMGRAFICNSGSEACEAAMKFAIQYHHELGKPRFRFIARENSYHGATLGSLGLGNHLARRLIYEPILNHNVSYVAPCYAYRQRNEGESDADFVARKAAELEQVFLDSPEPIAAYFLEPISGAALGCVPYVTGYLAAMKSICRKYGALFVLDEVMSGMGRSGTLHAWQAEHSDAPGKDCLPDIQMIGKGLGGGFQPVAGILLAPECVNVIRSGSGSFKHGQTYQAHPMACAAAYAVQKIVQRDDLLANARQQGEYLQSLLHAKLDKHSHVGDVRGIGLFWGIEFVKDKRTKEPFPASLKVAEKVHDLALTAKYGMSFYPCQGTVDGVQGDHVIIAPAYVITKEEVEFVAETISRVVDEVFEGLAKV